MSNQDAEVIVIGNRAVGKTSLLASMYMYMEKNGLASIEGMTFKAEDDFEYKKLVEKWNELKTHIQENQFSSTLEIPYDGTVALFTPHWFEFRRTNKMKKISSQKISFTDTKGGATNTLDQKLISRVNKSFVVFCVVDAAVLMECDDNENDTRNCPLEIKRILQRVLEDGDNIQPQACLFILTKCEKYMNTDNDRNELAERFNKIFKPVLAYAETMNYPLYYLPVQTMGCVEFSHIDPIKEEMIFNVLPLSKKPFAPKDVVFPLVFLMLCLLHVMEKKQERRGLITRILGWLLGWEEDFTSYYNELRQKLGNPTDFRSNLKGTANSMRLCNFWKN